jgi:hypothetical protein
VPQRRCWHVKEEESLLPLSRTEPQFLGCIARSQVNIITTQSRFLYHFLAAENGNPIFQFDIAWKYQIQVTGQSIN